MARPFDHNKENYKREHKTHKDQQTKHIISNEMLEHYGLSPAIYSQVSEINYRMGSVQSNARDRRIDNALIGEHFEGQGLEYDAKRLATGKNSVSYNQQLQAVGNRFDVAKHAYNVTKDKKFLDIQKDLRHTADTHLNADLRGFRLSKK